jgi:dihydrodipicolinate synthase/N-acetylneuraminate lyase
MNHNMPSGYERKFAEFIRLCRESKANGIPNIVVGFPSALGDNYEEVIESLSRLADAGLTLNIAARNPDPGQN